jgi:N-methylhydantoinase A
MAELEIRPEALESALTWLPAELDRLESTARAAVDADAPGATRVERRISLRFARQVHSLSIVIGDELEAATLSATFRAEYERLVGAGTAFASAGIEVVGITVEARAPVVTDAAIAGTQHRDGASLVPLGTRPAWFDGATVDCAVHDGATMPAGARITGPAFVELPTTTLVVYPGQVAVQEPSGDIRLLLPPAPSPC